MMEGMYWMLYLLACSGLSLGSAVAGCGVVCNVFLYRLHGSHVPLDVVDESRVGCRLTPVTCDMLLAL